MIYVLLFTAIFSSYASHVTVVHTEHDYPTKEACHAAYEIARGQVESEASKVSGVCLPVEVPKK